MTRVEVKLNPVIKVVGIHALLSGLVVAGGVVIVDLIKLYGSPDKRG